MNNTEHHYVECDCTSDEHTLRFTYYPDENEVVFSTFLNHYQSWYHRIWIAFKYVVGYKCKYGHFDSTIISNSQLLNLHDLLKKATVKI